MIVTVVTQWSRWVSVLATVFTKFTSQSDKLGQSGNGVSSTLICGAGCSNDISSPEHGCQYSHCRQLEFHHFYMAWLQDEKGWEKLMGNHVTTTKNEDTLLVLRVEKVGLHPHTLKEKKFWRSVSSSEASSMISCLISIIRVNMIMNSWLRDSQCECMYLYFHLYFLYLLLNSYLHFYLILIGVNMIMNSWLWVASRVAQSHPLIGKCCQCQTSGHTPMNI